MNYEELKQKMSLQKDEMTIAERSKAYFSEEEVDFIPYNIMSPDLAFTRIFGYTTKQSSDFNVKCDIIRRRMEEFGLYTYNVGLGLKTIGYSLGSEAHIPEDGIDYVEKHLLADGYEKLSSLEVVDPYNNPILTPLLEQAIKLKKMFPDLTLTTSVAGPFSTAVSLRPVEKVLRDTVKDKENLMKLLKLTVDCSVAWVKAFSDELGSVDVSFSDPVTCTDILNKKQFDTFSAPNIRDLVDGIEKCVGKKPGTHICGHTKRIWTDLADMGIRSLSLDNNENLEEAKNTIGDKMVLSGNVPPVDVMLKGSIDDVIESVKQCILQCGDSPKGYVVSFGCQLPLGVPRENIDAFIYATRKYGRDARIGSMPKGIMED